MEWEKYWNWLLSEKKFTLLVREMDEADESIGNKETIKEICHQIYLDYEKWRNHLIGIKDDFLHIIEELQGVHLQTSRIKTLDSLIGKVITKRHENYANRKSGYSRINAGNYKSIITDLIDMRLIINYRGKWNDIHGEIIKAFPYADLKLYDQWDILPHPENGESILVEIPKVYYAEGDDIERYEHYKLIPKLHPMGYRSIHYTVSYQGVYIEIQVRTIYDEAWSDCDHNYVYKQDENKSHTALEQMSFLLCQLTNFSNDFGECMRDIFENEAMEETDQNQWIASEEIYDVMEDSLIRIKDIYTQMEAFQNRLVKESAGGKHGSEV